MDKVDISSSSFFNPSLLPNLKPETKRTRAKGDNRLNRRSLFTEILENAGPVRDLGPLREMAPSDEALTELMDAVYSAGSDLKERPFHDEILRYKKAVRNFIHYVVENGYELKEIQGAKKKVVLSSGETKWNSKIHHQVQVVDKKLEELAAALLSNQLSQLERVSKIDEITGLLVDLTISGEIKERDD